MTTYHLRGTDGTEVFTGTIEPPPGGGSSPLTVVRVPLNFDTPDLVLTGIPIYTPAAGDVFIFQIGWVSIPTTPWNGATPALNLGHVGALTDLNAVPLPFPIGLDSTVNPPTGAHTAEIYTDFESAHPFEALDATPLTVMVDDGAGGDPGATQGEGELVLIILKAA